MTQAELGAALGWGDKGANRLAQYETNYRVPRKDLVTEMAKILDVNPLTLHEPPEMNILNGKSTGLRNVMTAVNGNRQSSGEIYINNSKTETLHLALNFGLLKLIRSRSVLSQLL